MRNFKALSTMAVLPTFTLHVVLTVPELGTNRALVAVDALNSRLRIEPTPKGGVLLESWTITATPPSSHYAHSSASTSSAGGGTSLSSSESAEISLSAVYKHAISLFRSIYTLTHHLPASKLHARHRRHPSLPPSPDDFSISLHLSLNPTILTFDASPSPTRPTPLQTSTHAFPALSTPIGSLKLTVRYLARPSFRIDTIESLISSRLFNQDAGMEESLVQFTPTVLAHRARESAAASGGTTSGGAADLGSAAMAIRPSLPQRHSRTISFPAMIRTPLPLASRQQPGYGGQQDRGADTDREYPASASERHTNISHLLPSSSPRYAQFHADNLAFAMPGSVGRGSPGIGAGRNSTSGSTSPPSVVSNLTRLHLQTGSSSISSSTSNPGSGSGAGSEGTIRTRPPPTPISAFKSSTFASSASGLNPASPSLRPGSGLGTPVGISRPTSSLPYAIPERGSGNTHSGIGGTYAFPSTSNSPPNSTGVHSPSDTSPPLVTSSSAPRSSTSTGLGYGLPRTSGSAGNTPPGATGSVGKTKRYSSSFHRRAPSAGASGDLSGTGIPAGAKRLSGGVGRGGSPLALHSDLPVERSRPSVSESHFHMLFHCFIHFLFSFFSFLFLFFRRDLGSFPPKQSGLLDPTENEEDLSEFIRAIDDTRQRGGSGLNTSRSSDSTSSSAAIHAQAILQGQGQAGAHGRRVSLAERRQSPLIGRLDLAPPSPRSPPARLQELNLYESGEREPVVTGLSPVPTTLNHPGVSGEPPKLDLDSKLQNMDDTFKKSLQGLKDRRKGINRAELLPTSLPGTSSPVRFPFLIPQNK